MIEKVNMQWEHENNIGYGRGEVQVSSSRVSERVAMGEVLAEIKSFSVARSIYCTSHHPLQGVETCNRLHSDTMIPAALKCKTNSIRYPVTP